MKKIAGSDKELLEVVNVLKVLNMDDIYVEIMEHIKAEEKLRRTENDEYYNEGISKGISQGVSQGLEIAAKNMLEQNYDIEKISTITGLSKQDIMKLN